MRDLFGPFEEGAITGRPVSAGEEGIAGGSASWSLDVVTMKGAAASGEGVEMGRVDVVRAKALKLRAEVIDTNHEDVLLRNGGLGEEGSGKEVTKESQHAAENRSLKRNDDLFLAVNERRKESLFDFI